MMVVGQLNVRVTYGNQEGNLVLTVVEGNGPNLFDWNWLKYLKLDWKKVASVRTTQSKSVSNLTE